VVVMKYRSKNIASLNSNQKTLRTFSGGLNTVDSDYNLDTRFSAVLKNLTVNDEGSLSTRAAFRAFTSFHGTIGSQFSPANVQDWGVDNFPFDAPRQTVTVSTVSGQAYVNVAYPSGSPHGLQTGNWIKGITNVGIGSLGGIPYREFNNFQWHTVEVITPTLLRIRTDTTATSTTSQVLTFATLYNTKLSLILRSNTVNRQNELGLVDGYWFLEHLIVVDRTGTVYAIRLDGSIYIVFNDVIAGKLPGSPRGWRSRVERDPLIQRVSFEIYKSSLIIVNGLDKPLRLYEHTDGSIKAEYLADEATGANGNTPIGNDIVVLGQYLCIAGDPLEPDAIHISARGTIGTFLGDPDPNDATKIFLSEYAEADDAKVTGLSTYRGRLVVYSATTAHIFTLGTYIDDIHVPQFVETLNDIGTESPRSIVKLNNELYSLDTNGMVGIQQSRLGNVIDPMRASDVIRNIFVDTLNRASRVAIENDFFTQTDRNNRSIITVMDRVNNVWRVNETVSMQFTDDSDLVTLTFEATPNLQLGDSITFYDFVTQYGVTITGTGLAKSYPIVGIRDDSRVIIVQMDQDATATDAYISDPARSELLIVTNDAIVPSRSKIQQALSYKIIPSQRILAWQEITGFEAYGELRSIVQSQYGTVFYLFDYHVMVACTDPQRTCVDGVGFYGQNVHAGSMLFQGNRWYLPDTVYFDPAGETLPYRAPQYFISDGTDTFLEDIENSDVPWTETGELPIEFVYESPWIDFGNRQVIKEVSHIAFDTEGKALFKVEAFVDAIYAGDDGQLLPMASLEFLAGDNKIYSEFAAPTYLNPIEEESIIDPDTIIGDGLSLINARLANDQRLHAFPLRFKILKLRITGDTTYGPFKLVSVSMYDRQGRIVGV
jgi:hypothetical protein